MRLAKTGKNFVPAFPDKEPTEIEVAWAAGFMEGEGTFNSSLRSFEISAYQSDTQPLEKLQKIFGGRIYTTKARNNRKINSRESYCWRASGRVAIVACMYMYIHLSDKRLKQIHNKLEKLARQGWNPS